MNRPLIGPNVFLVTNLLLAKFPYKSNSIPYSSYPCSPKVACRNKSSPGWVHHHGEPRSPSFYWLQPNHHHLQILDGYSVTTEHFHDILSSEYPAFLPQLIASFSLTRWLWELLLGRVLPTGRIRRQGTTKWLVWAGIPGSPRP